MIAITNRHVWTCDSRTHRELRARDKVRRRDLIHQRLSPTRHLRAATYQSCRHLKAASACFFSLFLWLYYVSLIWFTYLSSCCRDSRPFRSLFSRNQLFAATAVSAAFVDFDFGLGFFFDCFGCRCFLLALFRVFDCKYMILSIGMMMMDVWM